MKCENCSHAEMCKWVDELEGRGCDFYDGKPCELLILKSDIFLHQDDKKKWAESIEQEKAKGLIILPPYFTPVLVPDDVEIQIEQEPCDDAISREAAINIASLHCLTIDETVKALERLPPVTQKSGKWIDYQKNGWIYAQCSECGEVHDSPSAYCPSCGAKMVEPQERSEK